MPNENGYPTDEEELEIQNFAGTPRELIARLEELWHWNDFVRTTYKDGVTHLELITGGWSGNESLIQALEKKGGE